MSTLAEMRTEVLNHGFDSATYSSRVTNWLNEGLRVTVRKLRIRTGETTSTITTTSGTATSSLPSDLIRVRSIKENADDYNLVYYEDLADFDELDDVTTGKPTAYTIDGSNIRFWPIPDSSSYTLTLRYWKSNTALSADSDTPTVLPSDWHHLIVTYALSRAFRAEDDPEMANFYRAEYDKDFAQCAVDLQDQDEDGPVVVTGMWSVPPTGPAL